MDLEGPNLNSARCRVLGSFSAFILFAYLTLPLSTLA